MFAVPGWNLSSKAPVISKDRPKPSDLGNGPVNAAGQKNNGRKGRRGAGEVVGEKQENVNMESLDQLWNRHFGGQVKKDDKGANPTKKRKDKRKREVEDVIPKVDRDGRPPEQSPKSKSNDDRKVHNEKRTKIGQEEGKAQPVKKALGDTEPPHKKHRKDRDSNDSSNVGKGNPKAKIEQPKQKSTLSAPPPPATSKLTPLQQSMRAKLISARFRHLNETLYTSPSEKALAMFSESPEMFAEYHAGFSQQVKESWPENPVDVYINAVKSRAKIPIKTGKEGKPLNELSSAVPLPRRPHGTCTFADLGCGDAQLARGLQSSMKTLNLKFYNFDLHSPNTLVTKADVSSLPLRDGEIDVAVFCLSLMGTNWISFVEEAWRILRGDGRGEVWVAEVKSRFGRVIPKKNESDEKAKKKKKRPKPKHGQEDEDDGLGEEEVFAEIDGPPDSAHGVQDETDISGFVEVFKRRGFSLRQSSVNKDNKMFVSMVFTKSGIPTAGKWKGMKWVGTHYERLGATRDGKKRFLEQAQEVVSPEEERKVLKPCVYKIR